MKKRLLILLPLVMCGLAGCGGESDPTPTPTPTPDPEKQNFIGIVLNDKTFTYDGKSHSIYCENVPAFALVTYEGNEKIEVGEYVVTATIQATNYNDLVLRANLIIEASNENFTGITFEDSIVDYDGKVHSLVAQNVPSFATVTYTNNDKTNAGTYKVTAKIEAPHYNTLTLSAKLIINKAKFTGITFEDGSFEYDGYSHSIYVKGAPSFATVTYTNNAKSSKGVYTVTATIKASNYETLTLTAKLTIGKFFTLTSQTFNDRVFIYNGKDIFVSKIDLSYDYTDTPSGTTAKYYINGSLTTDPKVKEKGTYTYKAVLSNESAGYIDTTFECKVSVVSNPGGVDTTKEAYKLTSATKYKDLVAELLKGNFTAEYQCYDYFLYPDGEERYDYEDTTTNISYVTSNDAFTIEGKTQFKGDRDLTDVRFEYQKVDNLNVLCSFYEHDQFVEYRKYPAAYYNENTAGVIGCEALAFLKEGEDGGIEDGSVGGYVTDFGTVTIDEESNCLIVNRQNYYYHTEWTHSECVTYKIFNIGNTKISDVASVFQTPTSKISSFSFRDHFRDGIKFIFHGTEATICTNFYDANAVYLERKEYVIPAYIEGLPITTNYTGYYAKYYNHDLTGITYKVYFDDSGYYQGEYESLGKLKYWADFVNAFEGDGGTVLFYGEW